MPGTPPIPTLSAPRVSPADIRCVIVEDQGMFLDMLAGMIAIRGGIRIVAQARDVAAGRRACGTHRADVLILDLALPDGNGLEVARRFVETSPQGRVLVVTGQASDFVCPAWLNDNLQAVISKNDAFGSLRRELDELAGAEASTTTPPATLRSLSPREAEVFGMMGDGLTTRGIAERLGLSEHTVHTHRKRIARKLNTTGDEVLRRAIAHRAAFYPGSGR